LYTAALSDEEIEQSSGDEEIPAMKTKSKSAEPVEEEDEDDEEEEYALAASTGPGLR
jgi:hypothetical protein